MSKITEKDVIHLLEERLAKLQNKINKTEAVLAALAEGSGTKLAKKDRKVIKAAKTNLKKDLKKKEKNTPETLASEE